jgi:hypothetical protein
VGKAAPSGPVLLLEVEPAPRHLADEPAPGRKRRFDLRRADPR